MCPKLSTRGREQSGAHHTCSDEAKVGLHAQKERRLGADKRHHSKGTINGLRGVGGIAKHSRPMVKIVVGHGRPNVGVCGYG